MDDAAKGHIHTLEALVEDLRRQNNDLLDEVVALRADAAAYQSLNDRVFAHIISILGFVPKSPEEATRLLLKAFDFAMENDSSFKTEREKHRDAYRERLVAGLRRNRELREATHEVKQLHREVDALTQQQQRAGGNLDYAAHADKLADVRGRLEAAALRLELMQRDT